MGRILRQSKKSRPEAAFFKAERITSQRLQHLQVQVPRQEPMRQLQEPKRQVQVQELA